MKNKRFVLILAAAVGSGLLAGFIALNYLGRSAAPAYAAEAKKGQLAVAARDLPLGALLRVEDVKLVEWGSSSIPAGYATSAAELVGRGLISAVRANEPLLSSKLASKEEGGGLPILIPEGMRALSVRVDEVVGVAGFVLPGSRVDVLVTLDRDAAEGGSITRVILQNVQTLAAGQTVQRDMEGKPQTVAVITLLVSPEQAEQLTLAANQGRIQLALRNTLDGGEVRTAGVRASALLGAPRSAPAVRAVQVQPRVTSATSGAAAPARSSSGTVVETIRGGERTLSTFASGN